MTQQIDTLSVGHACLLEINRPELCNFLYLGRDDKIHFDIFASESYHSDVISSILNPRLYPVNKTRLSLEDISLIERAMSIALDSINRAYNCTKCEDNFRKFGVEHKGLTHAR